MTHGMNLATIGCKKLLVQLRRRFRLTSGATGFRKGASPGSTGLYMQIQQNPAVFFPSLASVAFGRAHQLLTAAALLALIPFSSGAPSPNVSPFASGLEYPRGLKFGPDGNLYVAEAGAGGGNSTDGICPQVAFPPGPYRGGYSSRISKISANGQTVTTVADLLPSAVESFGDVIGIADVAFIGDTLYALSSGGGCSHGLVGTSAEILRVNADGSTTSIANLSVFQQGHPTVSPHEGPG